MMTIEQITAKGQDALRERLLKEYTGSTNEEALLKEHYDNLQDLTSISKKTLKRFFRDKVQVGPQTRNLLAAVALGRKHELESIENTNNDYYLLFLETLEVESPTEEQETAISPTWDFGSKIAERYQNRPINHPHVPVQCWRRRIQRRGVLSRRSQEMTLEPTLLFSHDRAILLGVAGMGKTAYAQNLCTQWCAEGQLDRNIPIYIDLKSVDYRKQEHGLLNFVLKTYFREDLDWMVLDFLEKYPEDYYLIIDGFDELTTKEKNLMLNEVTAISTNAQYVIISRPYGFQDLDYPCKTIFELAGLNIDGQQAYIEQMEPGAYSGLRFTSLMTFIHGHPVLSNLSRSPMALSQIVTLLNSENSYSVLEGIKSGVDLQAAYNNHLKNM